MRDYQGTQNIKMADLAPGNSIISLYDNVLVWTLLSLKHVHSVLQIEKEQKNFNENLTWKGKNKILIH